MIQAAVTEYVIQASVLWACVMIYVLSTILGSGPSARLAYNPNKDLLRFHLFCWIIPIPLSIAPLITSKIHTITSNLTNLPICTN